MPISNSWLNSGVSAILAGIQELELNASGGGGSARYRYVTSAKISLKAGEAQILVPGTAEPVNREITINLNSGSKAFLFWDNIGESEQNFLELTPNQPTYKDTADGGIRLDAVAVDSDIELTVILRQQEPITYKLGADDVANVSVSLWVNTDTYYGGNISDYDIEKEINNFTSSDDGISGNKIFIINGFTPGERITFNIDAASAGYGGSKVEMQLINPLQLMFFLFHTGIEEHLWYSLPNFLGSSEGFGKVFKYGGKTATATGGELKVKPKLDMFAGRFVATNSFNNKSDTCIITDYRPNASDPKQGGTFTLGGF
ncbi:MAG: hypothetical protein AAGJ08_01835 [Cyanobacteria bacterium P01_H01_bin.35]